MKTIVSAEERIMVKTDPESSMTDIHKSIAKVRAKHQTKLENSCVGDSNSNGRVERPIQDVEGLERTLRSYFESKTATKMRLEDPIVPRPLRYAGLLVAVWRVMSNGCESFRMMKGRRTNMKLVPV